MTRIRSWSRTWSTARRIEMAKAIRIVRCRTRHRHDPFEGFLPSEIELVVEKLGLVTAGEVGEIVTGLGRDHLGAFDGSSNPFEERDVLLGSVSREQGD